MSERNPRGRPRKDGKPAGSVKAEVEVSREEVLEIALESYVDPIRFCKFFLQHLFPGDIPWVHRGLLAILTGQVDFLQKYGELDKIIENFFWEDSDDERRYVFSLDDEGVLHMELGKYTLIMMPRGSAKTTIAAIAVPLYHLLYGEVPFTAYVSEAAPHAKMQLHNVQRELVDNPRIQAVFGEMKPQLRDSEKWSADFFETLTGSAFVARGRGGQIRGLLHRGHRPGKIIIDDVEDQESVATDEQRRKTREWAYGDLMPALPKLDDSATIVALGTLLHRDSLLVTWSRDPQWTVIRFGAQDVTGDYWWPEWMDEKKLDREKRSYASAMQLHTYYMEYYNQIHAPETMLFRPEWFKLATKEELDEITHTAIYIDPAISAKRTADKTAIVVCGITKAGLIIVLDVYMQRGMSEDAKVEKYFGWVNLYRTMRQGVEATAYQQALVGTMRRAMFQGRTYFEITEVRHKTKKIERIKGTLQPLFASEYVRFARNFPELQTEMLDLRGDTNDQPDDGSDALAGCVQLLNPYAAAAAGELDLTEDEFKPIDQEYHDQLKGRSWRSA